MKKQGHGFCRVLPALVPLPFLFQNQHVETPSFV